MKKIIISLILVLVFPILILCGCGTKSDNYNENISERFVIIEKVQNNFRDGYENVCDVFIAVDKETKIMYILFCGGGFGIETLLNADGTPIIYDGEI